MGGRSKVSVDGCWVDSEWPWLGHGEARYVEARRWICQESGLVG